MPKEFHVIPLNGLLHFLPPFYSIPGFRSKFRKVFPFGFSLKDKNKDAKANGNANNSNTNSSNGFVNVNGKGDGCESSELVSFLTAATLCVSGPAISSQDSKDMVKSLIRPLEVPK